MCQVPQELLPCVSAQVQENAATAPEAADGPGE